MKTTGNLGLKKPDGTDIVDIADLNGNMDILDTAVKAVQDHAADTVKHITAAERTAWNAKASTAAATAAAAGLMSAPDKSKLDGIAAGANNYTHPTTHPPTIIAQDASNRFVTDSEKAAWNGKLNTSAVSALATANTSPVRDAEKKIAEVPSTRANVRNVVISTTSATDVATHIPAYSANYKVSVYVRVGGTSNATVTVLLKYADSGGGENLYLAQNAIAEPGGTLFPLAFFEALAANPIIVRVTTDLPNSTAVSVVIEEA